ncbi:tyrosine-type recombinase/integrase [Marinobacterium weihaiense]|uniref:Tyrosine-type recombinase/integrase n=1 Tax=Marinobacterium weihaiense TaxID=2851016 RepID=A0ABS6M8B6_9GAMM|nr:tyrosine-type recombinase/integrase [Marinobacterium weihaiense]MBV0932027.1 tyrosine-type recombinase/integrase [Marinobacterium weihaiense]
MRRTSTTRLTSITDAKARKFLNDASIGDSKELQCEMIPGFHLCKRIGAKGVTGNWRFRYRSASGKSLKMPLGKFPNIAPAAAAEQAAMFRADILNGIDPKQVIDDRKAEQRRKEQQEASRKFRTVQQYLDGPYTDHQSHKIDQGKHTLSIIRSGFKAARPKRGRKKYEGLLDRDMDSLSKADIIHWQRIQYEDGYAHDTVKRAYGALKTMLNHAVEHEYLERNPLDRVRLAPPPDKEQERITSGEVVERRRMLTPDELAQIHTGIERYSEQLRQERRNSRAHGKPHLPDLDAVPYPHWSIPFTLVAMHTGLRPGDIRTLTWQELNLPFKRLTKTPRKTRHHPDPMQIRHTLSDAFSNQMTLWHQQQGSSATGLVFPSERTGGVMSKKAHNTHWDHIIELGEVTEKLDFYCLRHHFISKLVSAGIPLLTVAHLAGHKSTAMIERHYGHLAPDQAANALAMLSESLSGTPADSASKDTG